MWVKLNSTNVKLKQKMGDVLIYVIMAGQVWWWTSSYFRGNFKTVSHSEYYMVIVGYFYQKCDDNQEQNGAKRKYFMFSFCQEPNPYKNVVQ